MAGMGRALIAAAVVVLLTAGVYLLLLWWASRRRPCAFCGVKALQLVNAAKATVIVDGKRVPDCWMYYECDVCGARYKDHQGKIEVPSDEEWAQHAYR